MHGIVLLIPPPLLAVSLLIITALLLHSDPGPFLSLETFYLATYMEYEIAVNPKNIFLGGALTSVTGQLTLVCASSPSCLSAGR